MKKIRIANIDAELPWIIDQLKSGGIGVLPTDTIYGIHGLALSEKVVNKIFELKKRDKKKALIVIISSLDDLKLFGIKLTQKTSDFLNKIWPEKVSVILSVRKKYSYLNGGSGKLAFRLPSNKLLQQVLDKTGPLVSTSTNYSHQKPAENLKQATKYFGDQIDFYVDAGKIESEPSTVLEIENEQVKIIRQGATKVNLG